MKCASLLLLSLCAQLMQAQYPPVVHENDSIRLEYSLVAVEDSIYKRSMFKNDILIEVLQLKDRHPIGAYKEYYDDGTLLGTGTFNATGQQDGFWKTFHRNGRLSNRRFYNNGVLEGQTSAFYANGQLKAQGSYEAQKHHYVVARHSTRRAVESKVGAWVYFHPNGQLKEKGHYWQGKTALVTPEERQEEEDELGEYGYYFKHDLKDGVWKVWDKEGTLIKEEIYTKGELIEVIYAPEERP